MFLPSFGGGGAEKSIVRLAAALDAQGVPVDLVVADAQGPVRDDVPVGVRIVDFGRARVTAALPGLVRYLRRERPAALLSAMYHANLVAIVAHGLARSRARLVVSERQSFVALSAAERGLKERLMRVAMRLLYPRAHAVTAVSKVLATELRTGLRLADTRVVPIYNPVVSARLFALAAADPGHAWLAQDVPVILGVGRLAPEKDFATLLHAVALVARHRSVRLVILGEGQLRDELTALAARLGIAERVDLAGHTANPWAFMRRAALFVLSSRSEGMPNALVEALALGTPVVSTDCPTGPREILGEAVGALVPVGDAPALAAAITAALNGAPPPAGFRPDDFSENVSTRAYRELLLGGIASRTRP